MERLAEFFIDRAERGQVPDWIIRRGIRSLCRRRLREETAAQASLLEARREFIRQMDGSPVAPVPDMANRQHYEVPSEFFGLVLGTHRKYSCCHWENGVEDLDQAEESSLELTCRRAGLKDGMRVLELGCGWGSLTLWMAEHFPKSSITAVSNSHSQREYIQSQADRRGLANLKIVTADMNEFSADSRYDRVISVEMFEHMRNYRLLMKRIAGWLVPKGRLFIHIFCHRQFAYEFSVRGADDWMGRYFFTGGIMPSDDLPEYFQEDLMLVERWRWSGKHYAKTADSWLRNLDVKQQRVLPVLERIYGASEAFRWWMRWRIFFMACSELFGFDDGQQWWVSHYLFEKEA